MQVPPDDISAQLAKILAGNTFEAASRSRTLLEYLVRETLAGRASRIKEYSIGVEAFGRSEQFDPRIDPIVRAEASRLRAKLEAYYAREGKDDRLAIVLPRGTYVPEIAPRQIAPPEAELEVVHPPDQVASHPWRGFLSQRAWVGASIVVLLVFVAAFFAGSYWHGYRNPPPERQALFLDVELHTEGAVASQAGPDFSISPDGTRIVFVAISHDGTSRLHLKRLDRFENKVLEGTEGVRAPFFSPDGSSVAFWASSKLKKTSLDGGAPVVLCEATDLLGGSWGDDGFIVAAIERQKLSRLPASGGKPAVILDLSKEGRTPAWPQVLPSTQQILYTSLGYDGADQARIEILSPSTGARSTVATRAAHGRVLAGRWLLYANQSSLFAQPINLQQAKAVGDPMPTNLRVPYSATLGYAQYDISANGTLVCRRTSGLKAPHWIAEGGELGPPLLPPGRYIYPAISADAKRLAISETISGLPQVMVFNPKGERLTLLPTTAQSLLWGPDPTLLVLGAMPHLAWVRADGVGGIQRFTDSQALQSPGSISPDGKTLAYAEFDKSRGFDLWTIPVLQTPSGIKAGSPSPFLQSPFFETYPSFSPDGRWIAYASNESGIWEVYVRAFPDNGTKLRVSSGGGRISRWSKTKQELLYRTDDQRLMVADYSLQGGSIRVRSVRAFRGPRLADVGVLANFDLAPDGRVLALLPANSGQDEQSPNHVAIVFNFSEELGRLMRSRETR